MYEREQQFIRSNFEPFVQNVQNYNNDNDFFDNDYHMPPPSQHNFEYHNQLPILL